VNINKTKEANMNTVIQGQKHIELGCKDGVNFRKEYYGLDFQYNDGGRKEAGRKGDTGDCVTRAIAIAANLPYEQVYSVLAQGNATQRKSKHHKAKDGKRTASNGISVRRKWFRDYMHKLGFKWIPTMQIGSGCKVHLRKGEMPMGRLVVAVSKHYTSMIDGIINDTYDPSRNATRCVYGYWRLDANN